MADDVARALEKMNETLRELKGKTNGWGGSDKSATDRSPAKKAFDQELIKTAKAFQILHGDTEQLAATFKKVIGGGVVAGIIMSVMTSLGNMGKTFTKMADIGQNFGGSILKMQELAGDSALSMEQFTSGITKASTVIAQMSGGQVKAIEGFNKYQTSVRNTLKLNSYYGMSLSQVTDLTAEHADTLRQTYQWDQMDGQQRTKLASEFAKNVTSMAAATGKSRDALLKQTQELLKAPRTAAVLSDLNAAQTKSVQSVMTMVNGISTEAGTALSQLIGEEGRFWNVGLGKDAVDAGLTQLNEPLEKWRQMALGGIDNIDPEQFAELSVSMRETILNNKKTLLAFPPGSTQRAAAENLLKFSQSLAGLKPKEFAERIKEWQQAKFDNTTDAVLMFETTLRQITGAFQKNFYKGLLDFLAPINKDGKRDIEQFQQLLKSVEKIVGSFAEIVGTVFGALLSSVKLFRDRIAKVLAWFGIPMTPKVNEKGEEVEESATDMANKIIAGLGLAALGGLLLKRLFGLFQSLKTMFVKADTVNVVGVPGYGGFDKSRSRRTASSRNARRTARGGVVDPKKTAAADPKKTAADPKKTAAGDPKQTTVKPTAAKPTTATPRGGVVIPAVKPKGFMDGVKDVTKGILKQGAYAASFIKPNFKKGLIGLLISLTIEPLIQAFYPFTKGKQSILSMIEYAGYGSMAGLLWAPLAIPGMIIGGIVGLFVENFKDISEGIGGLLGDVGIWIGKLTDGIIDWIVDKLKKNLPESAQWLFTRTPEVPRPANEAEVNATNTFKNILPQLTSFLTPRSYESSTPEGAKAQLMLDELRKLTPAMMAETLRLVKADPGHAFLKTPISDADTDEALNDRLMKVLALEGILDEQKRRGELSEQSTQELKDAIQAQTDLVSALLNHGNRQRDDASRRGNSQLTNGASN